VYKNGAPLRVSDIAPWSRRQRREARGVAADRQQPQPAPAIIVNIQRQPGANVIQTVDRITAMLPQLQASLPPRSTSRAHRSHHQHRASIADVQFELRWR